MMFLGFLMMITIYMSSKINDDQRASKREIDLLQNDDELSIPFNVRDR